MNVAQVSKPAVSPISKSAARRIANGAQVENETDLGEYEKINGVFFPFSIEGGPKGVADKQKIVFEKADANVPTDDTIFKFPTTTASK